MSRSRDRLGLLLPLPALLAVGPTSAHAQQPETAPADQGDAEDESLGTVEEGLVEVELPVQLRPEAREAIERAEQAFTRGEYHEAAVAFEHAADLAPELVVLWLDATIATRYDVLAQTDPERASEPCAAVERLAEVVTEHPRATPEARQRAAAERRVAEEHCADLREGTEGGDGSTVVEQPEVEHGPCLVPPHDDEPAAGCAHRRNDVAVLGLPLMLLGLRSRRRRQALERLADRLPADVVARLRSDDEPDEG